MLGDPYGALSRVSAVAPMIMPISVRVPAAVAMTGFSRSRIYELIGTGEIEIVKDRSSTLILAERLRAAIERRRLSESVAE